MDKQLNDCQGKKAVIELLNGRKISGTVLAVDQNCVRIETAEGIGTVPVKSILVVWEDPLRSAAQDVAGWMRDSVKAHIGCTGPQFSCTQQYVCRPPDYCTGAFSCPGSYVPSACGPFEFGSQCNIPIGYTCAGQQFYGIVGPPVGGTPTTGPMAGQVEQGSQSMWCQPCMCYTCTNDYTGTLPDSCVMAYACQGGYGICGPSGGACPQFMCGPFQYTMPCICQYAQPCMAQYMQPCTTQFMQPCTAQYMPSCPVFPFQPWNPQCGPLGSYTCREPFSGLTEPASVMSPESATVSHQPMGFGVQEAQGEDSDKKKE
ncbi:MAG: hypothetical protein A4E53_03643 [Pelotomaculum sp. PtaB.Bin104]|nr:MAG: hypothetical protein A4E53_03643 [Pelotomaculum sp. PtaB.Bin104]